MRLTPPGSRACGPSITTDCTGTAVRPRAPTLSIRWPSLSCTSTGRRCTIAPRSPCYAICTGRRELAAMAYEFQVVFDCQRPHELADWWAETMGWQVEPQDESFIKEMIAQGHAS